MTSAVWPLPAGINENLSLSRYSKIRVKKAIDIFNKTKSDYFIASGKHSILSKKKPKKTEMQLITEYTLKKISEKYILSENKSYDTVTNFIYCKKILTRYKITKLYVITSKLHYKRALFIYKKLFPEIKCSFILVSDGLEKNYFKVFKEKLMYLYMKNIFKNLTLDKNIEQNYKKIHFYYNPQSIFSKFLKIVIDNTFYYTFFDKKRIK